MRSRGKVPLIAVVLLLSSLAGQASSQEKVILDDDFGSFSPTLIMLLHSAQVEDELAAAMLLEPEIATKIEERYIDIEVKIVFDINRDAFWDLFVGLMTKPDRPAGNSPKDR